jgi:hypothetical protein
MNVKTVDRMTFWAPEDAKHAGAFQAEDADEKI